MNRNRVIFREYCSSDFSIIESWLNKDYIKQWFGEPKEWLDEIQNLDGEFDWINHFIVEYVGIPFGFCQYYDCSKTPKGFSWDKEPPGTFGIDFLIAEERFLNMGLGSVIIQKLTDLIVTRENPVQILADPDMENTVSIKLLEKNSFVYNEATGLYFLFIP